MTEPLTQTEAERGHPEPETKNVMVEYSNGEPSKVNIETEHFVDDLYPTEFDFSLRDGQAVLKWVSTPGDRYYLRQNQPAREEAERAAKELPFVEEVVMFPENK